MRSSSILAVCAVLSFSMPALADTPAASKMAQQIDSRLAQAWQSAGLTPAAPASDAEFLRRVRLDLTGIIPSVIEVREFLKDDDPDKRRRSVDRLLDTRRTPRHATHLATLWKNVMLPEQANVRRFGGDAGFQNWLRGQFLRNVPYDQTVSEVLLATGAANQNSPALFYTALELKPEDIAASTSRIFLGTQIQCAQCHDHPFDHWKQADFWSYAAFFARVKRVRTSPQSVEEVAEGDVKKPGSDEVVPPGFLNGELSPDDDSRTRRERLAGWITSRDNPYLPRATVNRVWALLFGRGLVNPIDDFGDHNPPTHPELLDDLAKYFIETDFDLQQLFRTLTYTQAYQLSSEFTSVSEDDAELFARMSIKTLSAEQLYDCLLEGMRRANATNPTTARLGSGRNDPVKTAFLAKFRAPTQGSTEYQAGIPQSLSLMNGDLIRRATDRNQSDLLRALDAPFFTDERRVEVLFLSTLSRKPTPTEADKFVSYVKSGGVTDDRRAALSDVLWALLNSAEFILNH